MKHFLLALSLLISGSSFAQDSVDMVLTDAYGSGRDKPLVFARISVSKRIYDLTKANPKIELVCKYSKDKDLQLGISKGQIYATHKAYNKGQIKYCNTTASCSAKVFTDLADWRSMAVTSPILTGDQVNNYSIESTDSWIKRRDRFANAGGVDNWKYAELENIAHLEFYSPSKHDKWPRANGFMCGLVDHASKKFIDP
ncbi:MAG: hypothetical protein WDA09_10495 [Bacteriovoracaceae bacterium]